MEVVGRFQPFADNKRVPYDALLCVFHHILRAIDASKPTFSSSKVFSLKRWIHVATEFDAVIVCCAIYVIVMRYSYRYTIRSGRIRRIGKHFLVI